MEDKNEEEVVGPSREKKVRNIKGTLVLTKAGDPLLQAGLSKTG